jgi:UDP-N-acetyl-D-galactosamine dehydrogenase
MSLLQQLKSRQTKISVTGLGYVGLPIALEFGKKFSVVGFDIDAAKVESLNNKIDPGKELSSDAFENADVMFTTDPEHLRSCSFHIIAVPTPVDEHRVPDLLPLLSASRTIGKILKQGDYVIYESTVYPGCTEEDCLPILEELSGLVCGSGFKLGYSPERINPGDVTHSLTNVIKIVSGCDDESLQTISSVYSEIVAPGVFQATSIKVAEAAKILENTQRDLNIALMNELSIILDKMNVNTFDVIEAAGTKWNFQKYYPGLVGGHCIGVDPYYLTYRSIELGYEPEVILSGRRINDTMAYHVAKRCLQKLIEQGKDLKNSKILVMGITFKENVTDIRNSKVADLIKELRSFGLHVDVVDAKAGNGDVEHEYGFGLANEPGTQYDAIIVAVPHREYLQMEERDFIALAAPNCIFIDIKGAFRNKISQLNYWSL